MSITTLPATQTWQLDPAHTQANFSVKHMMFAKVHGGFDSIAGALRIGDWDDLDSWSADVTIAAASINTGQAQRDEHLRSSDFFDVEEHPELTFRSTSVRKSEDGTLVVTGDLTIRGVTREVELDVEETGRGTDPWGNERVAFRASTRIDRRDFGLTWNQALEAGGVLVGHDIDITLEVQATPVDDDA